MFGISNVLLFNYVYIYMIMIVWVGCDGFLGVVVFIWEGYEVYIEIYELCGFFEMNISKVIESKIVVWEL